MGLILYVGWILRMRWGYLRMRWGLSETSKNTTTPRAPCGANNNDDDNNHNDCSNSSMMMLSLFVVATVWTDFRAMMNFLSKLEIGQEEVFCKGENVILSTTCRLGGIIMVRRSFCRAGRLIDYDDEDDEEMSLTTTSK